MLLSGDLCGWYYYTEEEHLLKMQQEGQVKAVLLKPRVSYSDISIVFRNLFTDSKMALPRFSHFLQTLKDIQCTKF